MSVNVLKGLRLLLTWSALNDESLIHICRFRLPAIMARILFITPLNITFVFIAMYSIDVGLDLKKASGAISLILGATELNMIYVTLAMKQSSMMQILDEFRILVQKSK